MSESSTVSRPTKIRRHSIDTTSSRVSDVIVGLWTDQHTHEHALIEFIKQCVYYPHPIDSSDESMFFKSIVQLIRDKAHNGIEEFEITMLSVLNTAWDFLYVDDASEQSLEYKRLMVISEGLFYEKVLSAAAAIQILDSKFLCELDMIKSVEAFEKSITRYKTTQMYMQKKFNLFREESEGYSKLIVALSQHLDSPISDSDVLYQQISSLIGVFDLDPNRVLDVLLDRYEHVPNNIDMFNLVKRFNSETIVHIIGFKFQNEFLSQRKNYNLALIAAKLIKEKVFQIESLYVHLQPSDENLRSSRQDYLKNSRAASFAKDNLLDPNFLKVNQKFDLIAALLEVQDFPIADLLLDRLKEFKPASHPKVSHYFFKRIHESLKDFSSLIYKSSILSNHTLAQEEGKHASRHIEILNNISISLTECSPFLYRDISLFSKICRILVALFSSDDDFLCIAEKLVKSVLLPAFSLIPSKVGISADLWNLLKLFDYNVRFSWYLFWKDQVYSSCVELIVVQNAARKASSVFDRRIAAGVEKNKEFSRQLVKITHSNPIIVLEPMLKKIQYFDNLGEHLVETFNYMTPLCLDVVIFILLDQLSSSEKEKLKSDGQNFETWFQSLCSFAGHFFRKFPDALKNNCSVLDYIIESLKNESFYEVHLLSELLANLSGVSIRENMTEYQILGQAGGVLLRAQIVDEAALQLRAKLRRATDTLKETFLMHDYIETLLLLCIHQKYAIVFGDNEILNDIRSTGDVLDRCQDVFLQFVEFLCTTLSPEDISAKIPDILKLCTDLHVQPEDAFLIVRSFIDYSGSAIESSTKNPDLDENNEDGEFKEMQVDEVTEKSMIKDISLVEKIRDIVPTERLSPFFYSAFWSNSLGDIHLPQLQYETAISNLSRELASSTDPKDKKKKSKAVANLKAEMDSQMRTNTSVLKAFEQTKGSWFSNVSTDIEGSEAYIESFFQFCVLPRCMSSDPDALFCAKFVELIHNLSTPHFSTILFFRYLFKIITSVIASSTRKEAIRFGIFLLEILKVLNLWMKDEETFNQNFKSKLSDSPDDLNFEEYKSSVFYGQQAEFMNALLGCLKMNNVIQRNTLLILSNISTQFPSRRRYCDQLISKIIEISSSVPKTSDVYLLSQRCLSLLRERRDNLPVDETESTEALSGDNANLELSQEDEAAAVVEENPQNEEENDIVEEEHNMDESSVSVNEELEPEEMTSKEDEESEDVQEDALTENNEIVEMDLIAHPPPSSKPSKRAEQKSPSSPKKKKALTENANEPAGSLNSDARPKISPKKEESPDRRNAPRNHTDRLQKESDSVRYDSEKRGRVEYEKGAKDKEQYRTDKDKKRKSADYTNIQKPEDSQRMERFTSSRDTLSSRDTSRIEESSKRRRIDSDDSRSSKDNKDSSYSRSTRSQRLSPPPPSRRDDLPSNRSSDYHRSERSGRSSGNNSRRSSPSSIDRDRDRSGRYPTDRDRDRRHNDYNNQDSRPRSRSNQRSRRR